MASPSLAEHLNWHVKQRLHRRLARRVLRTPPIAQGDDGVILFSMIGTAVLLPYLVAVKSLRQQLGRGRVVILDDGTLTAADHAVLAHHLNAPRIIAIGDVDTGPCPRGGTWERLLTILDLRADAYVIQVDSDTVTLGNLAEVRAAIDAGRDFTLRGEAGSEIRAAAELAADRIGVDPRSPGLHVQDAAEAAIGWLAIPGHDRLRYVRGCSGFAGFAPGGPGRALAEKFSQAMDGAIGRASWSRWGSEQVTSNFVVANGRDPLLLPYDRYWNFWNAALFGRARFAGDAAFVHFIGTYRFHGDAYLAATRTAIDRLG
ncbi:MULTISPECIES: hypothetical protein [unclassified Sphingomonas]|uniref:hypothetical protein n=1 Tax=unclassified Sphingomonas TaxID=196159 RepID=UPI0006F4AFD2|nr:MULTISPECIES: hypothetical protein [unclassified Sphingomonas]KQM26733.1 hypothetical protein ASE58_13680 [Sphingomonas sp. Leaf9]KQM43138.1 hypothetical protein ASE57_13685 [Sphingomonas sp. Leaf11]